MSPPSILALGEVLWDCFPEGPRFGGAAANFACHAAALGCSVSLVSAIGDDTPGHDAIEILQAHRVDTSLVPRIANVPTGMVDVKLDEAKKPHFTIQPNSAWDRIAWSPELETRLNSANAIYFGTLSQRTDVSRQTIRRALGVANDRGIRTVLDVNLRKPFFDAVLIRDSIARARVVKLSDDELSEVAAACGKIGRAHV